jgi:integrase
LKPEKGKSITLIAVQLTLLTFIRSRELKFARWSEVHFNNGIWTIPGEHQELDGVKYSGRDFQMKMSHLVPLSKQAKTKLEKFHNIIVDQELMFIGYSHDDKPISENIVSKALRTMGYDTKKEVWGNWFRLIACSVLIESRIW